MAGSGTRVFEATGLPVLSVTRCHGGMTPRGSSPLVMSEQAGCAAVDLPFPANSPAFSQFCCFPCRVLPSQRKPGIIGQDQAQVSEFERIGSAPQVSHHGSV
jgi:hypothetical protein